MMLGNVELRKLPASYLSVIVDILEINNDWKKVMSIIPKDLSGESFEPKYNIEHIRLIENYAKQTKQKCAEILFDEWGTSGRVRPTLSILKNIVVSAGVYRAADEIAKMLQESPPARPTGGPEEQIPTNVSEILNEKTQQISAAKAKDYGNNKNVYQHETNQVIAGAYYGVESIGTEDAPNLSVLHQEMSNKPTAQINSVILNNFLTESLSDFGRNSTAIVREDDSNSPRAIPNQHNGQSRLELQESGSYKDNNVEPSLNIDFNSVIFQDTNLIHFPYAYLESITNYFSKDPPISADPLIPRMIGSGGFGDVFIGNHEEFGTVAIKKANQQRFLSFNKPELASKLFNAEVKSLSKFRHKNIVSILGYSIDGPAPCIICEYISGGSLFYKISKKVLNEDQRIHIMLGAAEGLNYLHTSSKDVESKPLASLTESENSVNTAKNFMHGDIKSANILLTEDFEPKLCDFGLAKQYEVTSIATSPMGTSAYMSPEGLLGTITQKLDVYSYGVVLLELLTGLTPLVTNENDERINIRQYVKETCKNDDINPLLDPATQWTSNAESIFKLAQTCLVEDRKLRPTMSSVCDILRKIKNST